MSECEIKKKQKQRNLLKMDCIQNNFLPNLKLLNPKKKRQSNKKITPNLYKLNERKGITPNFEIIIYVYATKNQIDFRLILNEAFESVR